jgi:hypothetical protein
MGVGMEEPVLTLERMSGVRIDDLEGLDAAGIDRVALARLGADNPRRVGELLREPFGVAGLLQVVQLGTQRAGELLQS